MKKENRKLAQERRAKERARQEHAAKMKRILPPVIVIAVIAVLVIVTAAGSMKKSTGSASGSSVGSSSAASSVSTAVSSSGETLDRTAGVEVKSGDTVNIDYTGTIDGREFDGGSTNGQGTSLLLGSGSYIDGFEDGIIGHKVGETFDVNVTFPENYGVDSLNGKAAVFSVTINGVYKS